MKRFIAVGCMCLGLVQPAFAQHEHGGMAPKDIGTVSFETSCSPATKTQFNEAVALLHSFWFAESRDRCSEVRLGSIPEFDHERVTVERLLNDAALDAAATAVNEPNLAKPAFPGSGHVLLDDRLDVARTEGMQIENVLNRDVPRHRTR